MGLNPFDVQYSINKELMQIFAVDFAPIFGVVVGRVGRVGLVGLVGRRAVVRRTLGGKLNCTDRYGVVRSCRAFATAATSARGYGGQAIGLGGGLLALLALVVRRTPVLRAK